MNLVGTLAKVAVGVLVARGVGKMIGKGKTGGGAGGPSGGNQPLPRNDGPGGLFDDADPGSSPAVGGLPKSSSEIDDLLNDIGGGKTRDPSGRSLDDLLGGASSSTTQKRSGPGLEDLLESIKRGSTGQQGGGGLGGLLGKVLSGGAAKPSGGQRPRGGGLEDLLDGLKRAGAQQRGGGRAGGGLGDILGKVLSGGGASAGGLGGILDSLGGSKQQPGGGSLGSLLNDALGGQTLRAVKPDENAQAEILLRGMINAAKSDGQIDREEQAMILENLGDVSQDELDFVRNEMAQPVNIHGFIRSVPKGLEQQAYMMSLLGIKLDSRAEAEYLDQLAEGMGISHDVANQIHEQVGAPKLYR